MKRFTFRLERLRELRERAEREQAAVLGQAMREEQHERDALVRAQAEYERMGEQAGGAAVHQPLAAGTLYNLDLARETAGCRIDAAADAVKQAQVKVDEEQGRYGERRRDLRVVEMLKEKRFEAWKDDLSRAEQKEIDDVATRRRGPTQENS